MYEIIKFIAKITLRVIVELATIGAGVYMIRDSIRNIDSLLGK